MSALAPPGSVPWLLAHELRVALRGFMSPKNGRKGRRVGLVVVALVLVGLAAFGSTGIVRKIAHAPLHASPGLYLAVDAGLAWLGTLMLAQTLTLATQIFYERNDLDLLLSSPVPPGRVLFVRALGIALLASTLYVILASLLAVPLAFAGRPQFLTVYGVILSLGLITTAGGLLLALALFALIGPKRTRTISQVVAACIGALVFIVGQARNFLPDDLWKRLVARIASVDSSGFDVDAVYAWPARAFLGDPLALLAVAVVAAAAFMGAVTLLGRRFAADAAAGAGVSTGGDERAARRRAQAGDRASFRGGITPTLVRKDVRLLVRDPWLISQMALQVVYLLPLTFVVVRAGHGHGAWAMAGGAAALVFICGQLAGNLTWLVISAEDAPELIACAPVGPRQVASAKLTAGLAPTAALAAVPVLALSVISLPTALAAAVGMAGAAGSSALLNLWYAKPANRKEFRRRRSTGGWTGLFELLVILGWATATFLAVSGRPFYALIPVAFSTLVVAVMRRPLRYGLAMPD